MTTTAALPASFAFRTTARTSELSAIEPRLAARLSAGLTASAERLPHDITERLRFGREQALARAQQARLAKPARAASVVGISSSGAAMLSGFVPLWQRAAGLLPVVVLIVGLIAIDRLATREQVLAAADIDSALLADNLPPAAYSDPGFAEFLRSAPLQ